MSSDRTSPDYETQYTYRVHAAAVLVAASAINAALESAGFGPNNFSVECVPIAGDDDAEATHKAMSAVIKPDGDGGAEQLRTQFAASAQYALCDSATGVLVETNVTALNGEVGNVVDFDAFLTVCEKKRRQVGEV